MARCLPACCEANRHRARIPPGHFGFRTGSPRPLRGRGRRQDAGGRPPRRWNGWSPAGPPTAPTPGPRSERPPVPVRSTPSPATPPGTPSSAPASSTPSAPSAPFRGHERPRQDHGPGNRGLPQGRARRPGPRRGQRPAVPGMDQGIPLPRLPPGRQALQLAGAWRLAGICGQGLHRGAAAGEAASSPCTAGESAGTGRTGNRNPDRATPTARRTYPSAEPKPRGGLTRGGPRITIRRLGTTLRPPPISVAE